MEHHKVFTVTFMFNYCRYKFTVTKKKKHYYNRYHTEHIVSLLLYVVAHDLDKFTVGILSLQAKQLC